MNSLEIKGTWGVLKGALKQKWAGLTDDDLLYVEGGMEGLIGLIQQRTGETRNAIEKTIREINA